MEIGELRRRITFQKLITILNENGFEIDTWNDYKTVWASISNLKGREYYIAAAIKVENTVKFKLRYIDGLDTTMRIRFIDKSYNIISIDNIKYENKYIEIKAMEVERG